MAPALSRAKTIGIELLMAAACMAPAGCRAAGADVRQGDLVLSRSESSLAEPGGLTLTGGARIALPEILMGARRIRLSLDAGGRILSIAAEDGAYVTAEGFWARGGRAEYDPGGRTLKISGPGRVLMIKGGSFTTAGSVSMDLADGRLDLADPRGECETKYMEKTSGFDPAKAKTLAEILEKNGRLRVWLINQTRNDPKLLEPVLADIPGLDAGTPTLEDFRRGHPPIDNPRERM